MPELTRRRDPLSAHIECWHVYFGDVHVGTITERAGVPVGEDQWMWSIGFYPPSHRGREVCDSAPTFPDARAAFEAAWTAYLSRCTEEDFTVHRQHRAWTGWKYAMWEAGAKLPTQVTSGQSLCFCGAPIDAKGMNGHVYAAHMDIAQ